MSSNYTENGCLLLNWNLAALTKTGGAAEQMIPAASKIAVTTLTGAGLQATVTIPDATTPPTFFNGQRVQIINTGDAAFNGYFTIFNAVNAAGVTTFNYAMATAPAIASVGGTVSFLKFRMALVQADPANGSAVTIGPTSAGVGRSLIAGQEYQIPQVFGAFGEPVRYEMALWYWVGAAGTKLNIFWI